MRTIALVTDRKTFLKSIAVIVGASLLLTALQENARADDMAPNVSPALRASSGPNTPIPPETFAYFRCFCIPLPPAVLDELGVTTIADPASHSESGGQHAPTVEEAARIVWDGAAFVGTRIVEAFDHRPTVASEQTPQPTLAPPAIIVKASEFDAGVISIDLEIDPAAADSATP